MPKLTFLVSVFLLPVFSNAHAVVSDEKVRMWIASALENSPALTDADAVNKIKKPRTSTASLTAWKQLKECRDAGMSLDLELASAEHYAFIRSFAAEAGEKDIEALPALYGELKIGLGPVAQLLRTSDQPVSPPDPAVLTWGKLGVTAGLSDYTTATTKAAKPKTGKYQQYKLAVEGYYTNYSQTVQNPVCRVKP